MRGFVAVVCLAAVFAVSLTPAALDWFVALLVPLTLIAGVMAVTFLRAHINHSEPQLLPFLSVASGRAPPIG
jgi:hypothetical protein